MKTGELLEYNLRNTTQNVVEKLSPSSFLKHQNWAYLWIDILKVYIFCSIVCEVKDYRKWLKLSCRSPAFTSYKFFLTNKKRSGTSLSASFSAWFLKKNISLVILYYLTEFQCQIAFTLWDIGQGVYCYCLLTRLWRHKCWN